MNAKDNSANADELFLPSNKCAAAELREKSDSNFHLNDDIEGSHNSGWTRLIRACRYGQTETVSQILSSGADPTVCDSLGWNALPFAVASGNISTVIEVIKVVKWTRKDLASALCMAAVNGDLQTAEILLSSRATPNIPIEDSEITPLMLAAGEGHVEMVALLLEHGADPDMTNALHQTALDASVVRDHLVIQNILGPVTQLRSKISSHIPLPISPPNRALQPPNSHNTALPQRRILGASPFLNHCQSHNPDLGSSPMFHCFQVPSPMGSFCFPSSEFLAANSPILSKGFLSPLPSSYPSMLSPFHFDRHIPNRPSAYFCEEAKTRQNIDLAPDIEIKRPNRKSIAKGNTRLRKWWCQMKRRCKGDQLDRSEDLLNEEKSHETAMEKRLANFLRSIKMSEYYPLFTSQEIDFETFLSLSEEDLEEIGVKIPGHRSRIVDKIERFTKQNKLSLV